MQMIVANLSDEQLEQIAQKAYISYARRIDVKPRLNDKGILAPSVLWGSFYMGFASGFLKRHERAVHPSTFGIIREEWFNYRFGFEIGEEEREHRGFLYGL